MLNVDMAVNVHFRSALPLGHTKSIYDGSMVQRIREKVNASPVVFRAGVTCQGCDDSHVGSKACGAQQALLNTNS